MPSLIWNSKKIFPLVRAWQIISQGERKKNAAFEMPLKEVEMDKTVQAERV